MAEEVRTRDEARVRWIILDRPASKNGLTPEVNERIAHAGADVLASTPERFAAVIRGDLKRYSELIKAIGIRLD